MTTAVTANEDQGRYEIRVDGEVAGFTLFSVDGDVARFPHTEIGSEYEGQGLGKVLIRGALDDIRARGLKVFAICPFVRAFIEKNPEYQDLLVPG
ncbi:MAG: N-acetyltransferase [Actinomycetota bacterium]|nr:N-acetyltransferase [Actinomycetota bacterium]